MKTINVVAAVIQHAGQILCVQRGVGEHAYVSEKWEFPGGKVEAGESNEEALAREIREELHLDIVVAEFLMTIDHTYPNFRILLHTYLCTAPHRRITLTEHLSFCWLPTIELDTLDWAAADLPIVARLVSPAF
ncbi:(deoxy)nucleoside triphosphate pyrophosphohydrolase [Neolewinella antarctica]|uniref:8-oxo-dGTP diphosphatase n=1 Tax=Neolewinella antarctica TaxID=442734 RepID=A0ABX0XCZ6_9BACT|nr:(deoxy)nucleoside triphosphate pyrophosphohydrolase [Neolewinella antarctica]NJC26703.1 8-oxo-dGTP diphosphatase [Neolewinella antarctica]